MAQKVLIADDDPLVTQMFQHHLQRAGYDVLTAQNGREALELATRELPQVIVMDIMMSEMDGLTALRQLKKAEVTKDIPVIAITTNALRMAQQEAELAGAAVFLMKPFSPARLLDEVRRLIPEA
jgi:two-component system alkaline phosphatase synthesis response regulator PhoP